MDALNARMVDLLANQYNVAKMASNSSSLHTYFMVADALTKTRSDVSRPTAAFRSFVDAKLLNRFRFTIQAHQG